MALTQLPPTAPPAGPVNVSRGGVNTGNGPPVPKTPPLPQLISQQPLPNPLTDQYNQTQAMYQQALEQLKANQANMLGMQAQMNRMSATDPTQALMQRMMAMYQQDPYADLRSQMMQQYATPQRMSTAFQGMGY